MDTVVMELVYHRTRSVSRFLSAKQASSRASLAPTDLRCPERLRISQGMVEPKLPISRCNKTPTWRVLFYFVFGGPVSLDHYNSHRPAHETRRPEGVRTHSADRVDSYTECRFRHAGA
jgi:hypothetical protein